LVVFGVVEVAAVAIWLQIGRRTWFYIDEWDFLAGRKAGSLDDLFRPHNGHWTTLPVLTFRALYAGFGLRTYLPYRLVIIVLYLVAAALLLVVMRRAHVDPWIATAAATLFALFGAGWENIILPFQIAFTGSFTFGLAYLLVVDHEGPFNARDGAGLLLGLCSLMCSAVGVVMVAVVGAATLVRRGRVVALLHVIPMATCYALWLVTIGRRETGVGRYTASDILGFLRAGLIRVFGTIGPATWFGFAIVAVLVAGTVFAAIDRRGTPRLDELAAPVALFVGALGLLAVTAVNRASFGADWARQSRYVSLVGAMMLPALAVAADAFARRWRWCFPLAIAFFLVGIPANLDAAIDARGMLNARDRATRETIESLPALPLARLVPRSVQPEPTTAGAVTIGWLLDAVAQHRLDAVPPASARVRASDEFRLSFDRPAGIVPIAACRRSGGPLVLELRRGDRLGVLDNGVYATPADGALVGQPLLLVDSADAPVVVVRDVGRVRFTPVLPGEFRICGARMSE
jgi:hypothetical protein